jgi:RNA polymerase sigma factor (TIGR02999 family)
MQGDPPVTQLLNAWKEGDRSALDRLVPLVYAELQKMASAYLRREPQGQTLQPTALVHEAWLRLAGNTSPDFSNRTHFLGVAARLMRQILVDRARARGAVKRDAGSRVPLEDEVAFTGRRAAVLVTLDHALLDLEAQDPEKARILELKFFGGMTAEDSAELLGITVHKVNRQMRLAQAWLRREMASAPMQENIVESA